jgi:Protein of unknown function (DUF2934)
VLCPWTIAGQRLLAFKANESRKVWKTLLSRTRYLEVPCWRRHFEPLLWGINPSSWETAMSERDDEKAVRDAAYYLWLREGRPEGNALDHWLRAKAPSEYSDDGLLEEQEKVLGGQPADMQAIMTDDARGG